MLGTSQGLSRKSQAFQLSVRETGVRCTWRTQFFQSGKFEGIGTVPARLN
ncbi:MAG: hypothetical protein M1339_01385 [Bacteroidetes bacterium]|nr:hypothetical protein [Bacteroidota bacterium]